MKKKLFDRKLFAESLRQTRTLGLIVTVLFCIAPLLFGITAASVMRLDNGDRMAVNLLELDFPLYAVFLLFAPILAAVLFGFLNRRVSCDFWHAIPQTRVCLFVTRFTAALTWCVIAALAGTLCAFAVLLFFPSYFLMNWWSVLPSLFGILGGSVLVLGAVSLGITLTGTPLMNTVVSLMILFMPRLLINVWCTLLTSGIELLPSIDIPLLSKPLNVVYGIFNGAVENPAAGLYSLILGLLYAALALFFFCRRRSEGAGNSTPGKLLQTVFRTAFALLCCLPSLALLIENYLLGQNADESLYPIVIALYVLAAIAYFLFELITTHSVKRMLRAAPGLLIVALINLLFFGTVVLASQSVLAFTPSPEEIDGISITRSNYDRTSLLYYLTHDGGEIFIDDPAMIEAAADALSRQVAQVRKTGNFQTYNEEHYQSEYQLVRKQMSFRCRGREVSRNVWLPKTEAAAIEARIVSSSELRDRISSLPALSPSVKLVSYDFSLDSHTAEEIYNALRAAVTEASFEDNLATASRTGADPQMTDFFLTIFSGTDRYSVRIPLYYCDSYRSVANLYLEELQELSHREAALLALEQYSVNSVTVYGESAAADGYPRWISEKGCMSLAAYLRDEKNTVDTSGCYVVFEYWDEADRTFRNACFPVASAEEVKAFLGDYEGVVYDDKLACALAE